MDIDLTFVRIEEEGNHGPEYIQKVLDNHSFYAYWSDAKQSLYVPNIGFSDYKYMAEEFIKEFPKIKTNYMEDAGWYFFGLETNPF